MSAVTLHRCPLHFIRHKGHGCNNVQNALDEAGIEYTVAHAPLRKGKRAEVEGLSGQRSVPVIEFEDGSAWRADSKEIVAAIESNTLFDHAG
ncbi:MAG: glutathione S-transferase N-terminal domain-containing protein [Thermoleophilia bacterium]|jgi:glutathione S-transferase|nr:glutathione S-transferase N-terminal domain-containing protein [Thermoleophilia bacterium]